MATRKIAALILAAIWVFSMAAAQEIKNADGIPLKNPRITGFDGAQFTVEHDDGISKIPWERAPESIRVKYPKTKNVEKPQYTGRPPETPLDGAIFRRYPEVKVQLERMPGVKVMKATPDSDFFQNVRYESISCDVVVNYQQDGEQNVACIIFNFNSRKYPNSPTLEELKAATIARYGPPTREGGRYAAMWTAPAGLPILIGLLDTQHGPFLQFANLRVVTQLIDEPNL